jgi:rhodanese-related sulfurtransferase
MNLTTLIIIGVVIGAFLALGRALGRPKISPQLARQLVSSGARLLDVRTAAEFAGGHIAGAVNIPVQELGGRSGEVGPKEKPVVVYCHSGSRSLFAARTLRQAGFQAVHDLGAMANWERKA